MGALARNLRFRRFVISAKNFSKTGAIRGTAFTLCWFEDNLQIAYLFNRGFLRRLWFHRASIEHMRDLLHRTADIASHYLETWTSVAWRQLPTQSHGSRNWINR